LTLGVTVTAEIEDEVAHRVRGVQAIAEQVVERLIAGDG
jgi:hypothetical protein